jgi:hypothetical protein
MAMRSSRLMSCCLLIAALVACKKDTHEGLTGNDNNPTSYLLKKQTFEHTAATNGQLFFFEYNADNQVSQIKRVQWGYRAAPVEKWYDTAIYSFQYSNKLPVRCTIQEMHGTWYYDYTYSGNKIIQKTIKYANQSIQGYTLYAYNSDDKLIEVVDSTDKVNFRHLFDYDDNLTTVTTYNLGSNPQKKSKTAYSDFDTKINYIKAVNGLPVIFAWDSFNTGSYSSSSPNNYGVEKHFWDVDINASFGPPTTMNYSYEYNEEDLPVKMRYGGWTVTFEYQKYK